MFLTLNSYKQILLESTEMNSEIDEVFEIDDASMSVLNREIDALNSKALRYHLPPIELEIIREFKKVIKSTIWDTNVEKNMYEVRVSGKSPVIEGYKFLGLIDHTDGGNLIKKSPRVDAGEIPPDYKTASQRCDVCKQKRPRGKTFIMKMIKDSDERFPDKEKGDVFMVGSNCVKRFLPHGDALRSLIYYVKNLEEIINSLRKNAEENDDGYDGDGRSMSYVMAAGSYFSAISFAYALENRYVSRKQSEESSTYMEPTADVVRNILNPTSEYSAYIRHEIEKKPTIPKQAKAIYNQFDTWKRKFDFDSAAEKSPRLGEFFHNMKVIANSKNIDIKRNGNMAAALFGMFVREELSDKNKNTKLASEYIGNIGEKVEFNAKLTMQRSFDTQYGTTTMYKFQTDEGSLATWFSSRDLDLITDKIYNVKATVKKQEVSNYSNQKETIITRAKIVSVKK